MQCNISKDLLQHSGEDSRKWTYFYTHKDTCSTQHELQGQDFLSLIDIIGIIDPGIFVKSEGVCSMKEQTLGHNVDSII